MQRVFRMPDLFHEWLVVVAVEQRDGCPIATLLEVAVLECSKDWGIGLDLGVLESQGIFLHTMSCGSCGI